MAVARYYIPPENPGNGTHFPLIPMRDLTQEEYDGLTDLQKRDVDGSNLYQRTAPRGAKAERRAEIEPAVVDAEPAEDGDTDAR